MRDDRLAAESYAMVLRMNAISRPPYFALLLGMTLLTLSGCRSKDTLTATGDRGKPIHLGDRIEWVTATHGLPDKVHLFELLNQKIFVYGNSFIRLKDERVFKWQDFGDLNLPAGAPANHSVGITQGSLRSDVIMTHGKPDETQVFETKEEEMLIYGNSWIRLRRGSVIGWQNTGDLFVFDRKLEVMTDTTPRRAHALMDGVVYEYTVEPVDKEGSVMHHFRKGKPIIHAEPWPKMPQ